MVGQTIAFCGLSCSCHQDRPLKPMVCPTSKLETEASDDLTGPRPAGDGGSLLKAEA